MTPTTVGRIMASQRNLTAQTPTTPGRSHTLSLLTGTPLQIQRHRQPSLPRRRHRLHPFKLSDTLDQRRLISIDVDRTTQIEHTFDDKQNPRQISRAGRRDRLLHMNIRHSVIDSALDELTLVAEPDALIGLYFRHHWRRPPEETFGRRVEAADDDLLAIAANQVVAYLAGTRDGFDLPVRLHGVERQQLIWKLLSEIGYGDTVTYGELATALADGTTAQEVGQAVGRNPVSIVVPCHRVVGKNGQLTGYAGGVKRKQFLLELEEPAEAKEARLF